MEEKKFFEYKGFPLVRKGNQIIYGDPGAETIVNMQIMSSEKINGVEIAKKVRVYHSYYEAPDGDLSKMIIKSCDRASIYEALDVAHIWLTRN